MAKLDCEQIGLPLRLLHSMPSPYSAKVRMAARFLELDVELVPVATADKPDVLLESNPLGKIPTLLLDDGTAVFDSRAIMQELNRQRRNRLYPANGEKRRAAETLEALADGMCDAMLAIVYEKRMRPEEKWHEPWQDAQWEKVERALDHLEQFPPRVTSRLTGGQFGLAAALGYADLRLGDRQWSRGRPKLRRFLTRFMERFEGWDELRPQ